MRIIKRHTLIKPANNYVIDAPQPSNISYWWNVGSLLGLSLGIQIITGVTLAMHYNANVLEAFNSVEHIMRDVNNGWLIRYLHANAASAFFFLVYLHIGRGLYYGSYKAPRTLTWALGTIILILMMATAFLGYVLPYGQMSLWGATVITNLLSAIPWVGQSIVEFVWGGFSVNNATLNRFFSLHFVLPFILAALVLMHLIALHDTAGSNNPLGVSGNYDRIPFAPYFIFKDIITIFIFMWILSLFVFFVPNVLGDSENYVMANPMQTPPAIVPEWYLLPFYAILRSIPNKLLGVISMFSAILIILYMTIGDVSKLRGSQFKPLTKGLFFFFIGNLLLLLVLGAKHVESPFIEAGQAATVIYFVYFGLIVPITAMFENSINEFYTFVKDILSKTKEKYNINSEENIDSPFNNKKLLKSFLPTPLCFLPHRESNSPNDSSDDNRDEPHETMQSAASRRAYIELNPEQRTTLPTWEQLYRKLQENLGQDRAKKLETILYGNLANLQVDESAHRTYHHMVPAHHGMLRLIYYNSQSRRFDAIWETSTQRPNPNNSYAFNRAAINNTANSQNVKKRFGNINSNFLILISNVMILITNALILMMGIIIFGKNFNIEWSSVYYKGLNILLAIPNYIHNTLVHLLRWITNNCDAPTPWGLYFQDSASPQMEALAELHDNIMFYLVIILFAVGWMLAAACVKFFKWVISNKFVSHGSLVEIIWTFSPGIILILIAFTSFKLLYLMDEVSDVNMSLYIEGHQWYWSYQYPDFLNEDAEFIEYDSYLTPESDLEPGAIRMLDVDERVILPELTHVRFIVSSGDVIHCYACPSLGIKADAYPGRLNQASALINRLGTFYGQCSEICGILHSSMPIAIESVTLEKFLLFLWEK